jgi:hypothetical protein
MGDLWTLVRRTPPKAARQITRVLDEFPFEAQRIMATPAAEATLGKIARIPNVLNTAQETFFRRALFDARLRNSIAEAGGDIQGLLATPANIPQEMIQDAADFALRGTYAAQPAGRIGQRFMQAWHAARPIATLIQPFPRFFVNAYGFLLDHSPAGYLRLMGLTNNTKLLDDPKAARQLLAKAHVGTAMLAGALAMRNSDQAGERWWEWKAKGKTWDLRPFAPFSTFLFYGELMKQLSENPDPRALRMTLQDQMQGLLSINRIAGTGLVAVDLLRQGSLDRKMQLVGDMVNQYIGGFTVPFATLRDVLASSDPEAATLRDTRTRDFETSVLGVPVSGAGAMRNIPGLYERLPAMKSPLRSGPIVTETPLFRQFTGLTGRTKNAPETEIDRLAIEAARINPTSGIPEFDRLVAETMAPAVEAWMPSLLANPRYQRGTVAEQRDAVDTMIGTIRKDAKRYVKELHPDLADRVYLKGLDTDIKDILRERGYQLPQ